MRLAVDALGLHVFVQADGGLAGGLGLAAALESEDAHFEIGGCDLGGLKKEGHGDVTFVSVAMTESGGAPCRRWLPARSAQWIVEA